MQRDLDWSRTMVIRRTWIREKVVLYQWRQSTRRMGQNCRANDDNTRRKHTPSLPIHESIVRRSAFEQRWWKIVNTPLRRPGNDWNFSHNYFCKSAQSSRSSRRNVWRMWIEQGDLLWKDNPTHCSCQVGWRQTYLWLMILHKKKIYCEDIENELKSYHNKTEWANFVLMQDSWPQLKSDSISWRKTLKNSHNSQIQWPVVSTQCQEMKVHQNRNVGFEGTPRLDPYWKLQPVAYKVNMEWKSELSLWTKTILTRGS